MGTTLFWDVDTQHDFIAPDGKLHVPGAPHILSNLKKLTTTNIPNHVMAGSADAHTPRDREFNEWPEHCVYGTPGQRKVPESTLPTQLFIPSRTLTAKQLRETINHGGQLLFEKQHNDVRTNPNVDPFLRSINPDQIVVYGVATDICVDLAVKYLAGTLGYSVTVLTDAIKEIDASKARECISNWQSMGVKLRTTDEFLKNLAEPSTN